MSIGRRVDVVDSVVIFVDNDGLSPWVSHYFLNAFDYYYYYYYSLLGNLNGTTKNKYWKMKTKSNTIEDCKSTRIMIGSNKARQQKKEAEWATLLSIEDCFPCSRGTYGESEGLTTDQCSGSCSDLNTDRMRFYGDNLCILITSLELDDISQENGAVEKYRVKKKERKNS